MTLPTEDVLVCHGCIATFKDTEAGREGFEDHECGPQVDA